jgi:hypothetical protein
LLFAAWQLGHSANGGNAGSFVPNPSGGGDAAAAAGGGSDSGTPVQFGIFPVNGNFGINAVIGSDETGQAFTFYGDGNVITPYTVDCRPFLEAAQEPFYGSTVATRCDYLFSNDVTQLSVSVPNGYSIKTRGITLVQGAVATSDSTWTLP